jgi:predicted nuclease of restriction endonuclease-like (RecB) superfamily
MLPEHTYTSLLEHIGQTFAVARGKAYSLTSHILLEAYWNIGKQIVEFEQHGYEKAEYGKTLMKKLSKDLSLRLGKGFSLSNLYLMRQFYEVYPIFQTSGKLTWSHYAEIFTVSDPLARSFYEKQCANEGWSVRQLKRQIQSGLFQRLALSKDKAGVLALAAEGHHLTKAEDIVRDPYILEFLGVPEDHRLSEKELETKLIDKLQDFLLELGKGFTFVGRQFRITLDNRHYHVDLVFYHRILRCFVLIDLKTGKVQHEDIGQMNMYLNYFRAEQNVDGDTDPIGIVLCADKHEILVEYALGGISNQLFVSKYQLYFPDTEELQRELEAVMDKEETQEKKQISTLKN